MEKCNRCGTELDCMAGCCDHQSNWYCRICDAVSVSVDEGKIEDDFSIALKRICDMESEIKRLHETCNKWETIASAASDEVRRLNNRLLGYGMASRKRLHETAEYWKQCAQQHVKTIGVLTDRIKEFEAEK